MTRTSVSGSGADHGARGTRRLVLCPLDAALAGAIAAGDRQPDWARGFPQEGDLTVAALLVAGSTVGGRAAGWPLDPLWGAWVVRTLEGTLIGTAGFHGPPVDGAVEVGYGIEPGHRRLGLGTEAVRALLDVARSGGARTVIARVAPPNDASLGLLRRLGFEHLDDLGSPGSEPGSAGALEELTLGLPLR